MDAKYGQLTLLGHVLVGDVALVVAGELRARPGAVELKSSSSAGYIPTQAHCWVGGHSRKS